MGHQLRLTAVMAHPDDESLGVGGTRARYAARGVATHVVTATRGERGRYFTNENRPSTTRPCGARRPSTAPSAS